MIKPSLGFLYQIFICITQASHNKNYDIPRLFLMFWGIEYDFWLLRI